MNKVLLVDDDAELGGMLREYLQQENFDAVHVQDGEQGVKEALSGRYALVVLDVMMPRLGGLEVLRRIRAQSQLPVIMLTAKGDDLDRVLGLELGADDYVPKPCTPRELVARVRAVLRRAQGAGADAPQRIDAGPLVVWPQRRSATWHDVALSLTSTEYNLLEVLARNAGQPVSKADLSQQALGRPLARFDRSIDVHMSSIRQKLSQQGADAGLIQTVRGIGYQLLRT
ncbi:MAG TPA: response regulator transcription factor [Burkholderiales bacterium]|nr:response regulator transcription factor [Burkholderiales bacterium]